MPVPIPLKTRADHISQVEQSLENEHRTTNHPVRILRRTLQYGANYRPSTAERNSADTAISVAYPTSEQAADQGSRKVVYSIL